MEGCNHTKAETKCCTEPSTTTQPETCCRRSALTSPVDQNRKKTPHTGGGAHTYKGKASSRTLGTHQKIEPQSPTKILFSS